MTDESTKSDPVPINLAPVLANREPTSPYALDDVRLQKLWLNLHRRRWRSLAIIGASRSVETLIVAETLAKIAWWYRGEPSCVFDLRDLSLRLVEYHVNEINAQTEGGARALIALRSLFENPTAVPIAQGVDAVLLCLVLGKTRFADAQRTIAEVGRDRLIGSMVLSEPEHSGKKDGR